MIDEKTLQHLIGAHIDCLISQVIIILKSCKNYVFANDMSCFLLLWTSLQDTADVQSQTRNDDAGFGVILMTTSSRGSKMRKGME